MTFRESRLLLLKAKSKGVSINMSPEDWKTIVDRTEGYSGSDLTNVVEYAIQEPISELDKSHFWILSKGNITFKLFFFKFNISGFKDSKWLPCTSETLGCLKGPLSSIPPDKVLYRVLILKIKLFIHNFLNLGIYPECEAQGLRKSFVSHTQNSFK